MPEGICRPRRLRPCRRWSTVSPDGAWFGRARVFGGLAHPLGPTSGTSRESSAGFSHTVPPRWRFQGGRGRVIRTTLLRCPKWIGSKKTIARGRAQTATARSETGKRHTTTIPDGWPRPEAGGRFPSPGDALWWPGRRRRIGGGRHIPTRPGRPVPWPPGWGRGDFAEDVATGWGVPERTPADRAAPEVPPGRNGPAPSQFPVAPNRGLPGPCR